MKKKFKPDNRIRVSISFSFSVCVRLHGQRVAVQSKVQAMETPLE